MTKHFTRRSALTIIAAGGASLAAGRVRAEAMAGREVYPVAVPVYQTQFVADKIGYFKEAGLDCKLIQGGSGVKTREIIASSQGDIGIGDITHPMQLSNHGRNGRVLLRPSGTEPLVRVMAEAPTQDDVDAACARIVAVVEEHLA